MMEATAESPIELMDLPFIRQMVVQLRALDSYGTYDTWSDDKVLEPLILTKERKREIPVIGDPDEIVVSRVKAYYNALSTSIEKQVGMMAVPFVNLTHEGFGRAIVTVGKLVVIDKTLRDVHRFGFASVQKLHDESSKLIKNAVAIIEQFPEAARS